MLKWIRRYPNSANNFDLLLANPQELDSERLKALLANIEKETYRNLTLSSRATTEFRRWFDQPDTPLKSEAYVLLSNWFTTRSGDRNSAVASRCEDLWDALFPCRPVERLSSSKAGRNHVAVPAEFERFWRRLVEAPACNASESSRAATAEPNVGASFRTGLVSEDRAVSTSDRLRAMFDNNGLHFEVEGSPRALADFLKVYGQSPAVTEESK